jgi:hypothetical protein
VSTLVDAGQAGLRSLAIALEGGLGAVGAGVGIGMILRMVSLLPNLLHEPWVVSPAGE